MPRYGKLAKDFLPGHVTIGQPISHRIDHMLSGTRANIAVKIFGDDLPALRALARQVEATIRQVPGAVDVILFGLLSSTALNMIVVPSAYCRFGRPDRAEETRVP